MGKSADEQLERMIKMQYERLAVDFGYSYEDLLIKFTRRQQAAIAKGINIKIFYRAELEAIEVFKQRLLSEVENKKQAIKKRRAKEKSIKERSIKEGLMPKTKENFAAGEKDDEDADEDTEEDENDDENDDENEDEPKDEAAGGDAYRPRYEYYRHEPIHKNAPKEIEHLFGCLIDFRKKNLPALLSSMDFIKDKSYRALVYELETLLDDAALYDEVGNYPLVFANYIFKLKSTGTNSDVVDRAGMDVYKVVISMLRKLKRVLDWLTHPKARYGGDAYVTVEGDSMSVTDFAHYLLGEMKNILVIFGLTNL